MSQTSIQNIVFDIGNVFVVWNPEKIIKAVFPQTQDYSALATDIFGGELWRQINRGELTEAECKDEFVKLYQLSASEADALFTEIKSSQALIEGTVQIAKTLKELGYGVYALTDNVTEIVDYLKQEYDFWELFDGDIVSADVGLLKPQQEIYQSLTDKYGLEPSSCLFFDDMPHNVAGAQSAGWQSCQFSTPEQCLQDLGKLGLVG